VITTAPDTVLSWTIEKVKNNKVSLVTGAVSFQVPPDLLAGTNTSGFSALLAGSRWNPAGDFFFFGDRAYCWTSSQGESLTTAGALYLGGDDDQTSLPSYYQYTGFSVRCLQD